MYNDVRPGPARYVIHLDGVKASHGELTLRVHAFRPPDDVQISLVAGARLALEERDGDVSVEARFTALRGVVYAFYGYFSEDTDIEAAHVKVELHEYEGEDVGAFIEPPRSALAADSVMKDARPANALIHFGRITLQEPVSQDCTVAQLVAMGEQNGIAILSLPVLMTQWREQACLASLSAYGVVLSGLHGLVIGPVSDAARAQLATKPFILQQIEDAGILAEQVAPDDFVDFLLWPQGGEMNADPQKRWEQMEGALGHLKVGGMAAIGLSYRSSDALLSSQTAADHRELTRNEIGQWALRLIGKGFSVAPLAFAAPNDLALDEDRVASFILIVQRQ